MSYVHCPLPTSTLWLDQHFFGDADEFVPLQESAISTPGVTTASVTAGQNAFDRFLSLSVLHNMILFYFSAYYATLAITARACAITTI